MGLTTAIILGAIALGGAAYQGEQQKKIAKKANKLQDEAMRAGEAAALSEQRQQMADRARLNRKRPNVDELMANESAMSGQGVGGTMLTGAGGARTSGSTGSASLLGG